jgi:NAD(P)-dependent dehydrogenase (short-subunit alcohol dehydrogenase family)
MPATPVAIVTGGAAGIGREACHTLAETGFAIVCADIDGARAESAADEVRKTGRNAAAIGGDVSRETIWGEILKTAEMLGPLEVLVSNAAIFPRLAFADTRVEDFDRVMAVNLRAAFIGASVCVPQLRKTGGGALVFMTSGSGLATAVANPMQIGFSLYGASKAALDRWVTGIAPELSPMGIAANLLCPGLPVATEGFNKLALGGEAPSGTISARRVAEVIARLAKRRPPHTGGRFTASEFTDS